MAVVRRTAKRSTGPLSDITEVAEQRALVPLLDVCVDTQRLAGTNRGDEIGQVLTIAQARALFLFDQFVTLIENPVIAVAVEVQRPLFAVERDEPTRMRIATQAVPGDRPLVFELKTDRLRIGRLLLIVEAIAAATGRDADRIVRTKAPPAQVECMDAIVAQFAVPPVPEPMPVVGDAAGHIRPSRGRALPQIVVEAGRHGRRFLLKPFVRCQGS